MKFPDLDPAALNALHARAARIWAEAEDAPPVRGLWVDDSSFERGDEYLGRCADDDEMADRAADREWAGRWPA